MQIREVQFEKFYPNGKPTSEYLLYVKALEHFENGGTLHETRKSLPFFEDMRNVIKKEKRHTGKTITNRDALERVGIFGYSDIYFSLLPIFDLPKFKDANGNVDSYRKDGIYAGQYSQFSKILDMPESLVIQLVGNENLETSILHTDLVSYVRKSLQDYLDSHGTFINIKRNNPPLYELMRTVKNNLPTPNGVPMSMGRFVSLLGFSSSTHKFSFDTQEELDIDKIVSKYVQMKDKTFDYEISIKDISKSDYHKLQEYAQRKNISFEELFKTYALEYKGGINCKHLKYVSVSKYPYIDEMRKLRDWAFEDYKNEHPDLPEEYLFERYVEICQEVYSRFKDRIHSFNTDPEYATEKVTQKLNELYAQNSLN